MSETATARPRDDMGRFIPRSEVDVEVTPTEAAAEQAPQNVWQQNGFLDEIARVCQDLQNEPEHFLYPSRIRDIIQTVSNAQTVHDFDSYNLGNIEEYIHEIRQTIPAIERDVVTFTAQLNRARTVQNDFTDFI